MSQGEPPKTQHGLFPAGWVVGPAAAALAKDGDGVLIDERAAAELATARSARQAADAAPAGSQIAEPAAPSAEPVEPAAPRPDADSAVPRDAVASMRVAPIAEMAARVALADGHPGDTVNPADTRSQARAQACEREIAELRAENERLRLEIESSRRNRPARQSSRSVPDGEPADSASLPLDADTRGLRGDVAGERPKRAWRRAFTLLLFLVVIGGLLVSWMAAQRIAELDGPLPGRIQTLRAELAERADGTTPDRVIEQLVVAADSVARQAGRLGDKVASAWHAITSERAGPAADTPPDEPAAR